jgi:hypothetical protein
MESELTTGVADPDSDDDGLLDGAEFRAYGTNPLATDSDEDGCSDAREAADINGSRTVSSIDLAQVAQRFGAYRNTADNVPVAGLLHGQVDPNKVNYDYNKDGTITSSDLGQIAQLFGNCPNQGGPVVY